ncbi:hypothetical protein LCGC14_1710520, partial [marine sediment metagenome]
MRNIRLHHSKYNSTIKKKRMSRIVKVCAVWQPVEIQDPEDDESMIIEEQEVYYYFLHWGLTAGSLSDEKGGTFNASWTVAICQHIETGQILTFIPDIIKFVGHAEP